MLRFIKVSNYNRPILPTEHMLLKYLYETHIQDEENLSQFSIGSTITEDIVEIKRLSETTFKTSFLRYTVLESFNLSLSKFAVIFSTPKTYTLQDSFDFRLGFKDTFDHNFYITPSKGKGAKTTHLNIYCPSFRDKLCLDVSEVELKELYEFISKAFSSGFKGLYSEKNREVYSYRGVNFSVNVKRSYTPSSVVRFEISKTGIKLATLSDKEATAFARVADMLL